MKTLKYLLIPALTGLLFVACNTEPKGPSQAELDTQVDAKVKAATDQLKADCDNRIMQAAQMKADSVIAIAAKRAGVKKAPPTPKATTPAPPKVVKKTPPPKVVPPPPPPPPNQGKKTQESGENKGKKGVTNEEGKTTNEGVNMGKKK
jgi:hypothetical protein